MNCNLLDWRAIEVGLFDRARLRNIGIIARTPLAFGFLAGRLDRDTVFPGDDHRSKWSRERFAAWVEAADCVVAELDIPDSPPSRVAVALRFCLSFEAVATVIPGMCYRPRKWLLMSSLAMRGRSIQGRHPVRRERLSPL